MRQSLLQARSIEQGLAGQEEDFVAVQGAYQGRVEEALVVGHDDGGAVFNELLAADDLVVEQGAEEAAG